MGLIGRARATSLLGLLHTAQTSIKGLVGLVKLVLLLYCQLQLCLQWGDGVGPHSFNFTHIH